MRGPWLKADWNNVERFELSDKIIGVCRFVVNVDSKGNQQVAGIKAVGIAVTGTQVPQDTVLIL
jgi:hypothetical protein